ncbi:MAG: polyphosphate polymerase domain-containing protein [Desulfobacteraceae bacterium]|jgi:hypothetical protein|nr:polyphosphate polymerase domain-containing protein [Desulfobacteraceae bacterium]
MLISSGFTNTKTNNAMLKNNFKVGSRLAEPEISRTPAIRNQPVEMLLAQFKSHSLDGLNNAGLMNRVDTKYILPISDLEKLLLILEPFYTVLEIDFSRSFAYRTTYFDTSEFGFYLMHHNGKLNRFKVRHRLYVDSGDLYVEVKHKTNKRVTQKDRVLIDGNSSTKDRINTLVSQPFEGSRTPLFKSLICSYVRIALADETNGERVTLDFNLSFADPNHTQTEQSTPVLIAEVKRENRKVPSKFIDLMDRLRHKPVSFSKYCIGCALVHSDRIKTNRFKSTLNALAQISSKGNRTAVMKNNVLQ